HRYRSRLVVRRVRRAARRRPAGGRQSRPRLPVRIRVASLDGPRHRRVDVTRAAGSGRRAGSRRRPRRAGARARRGRGAADRVSLPGGERGTAAEPRRHAGGRRRARIHALGELAPVRGCRRPAWPSALGHGDPRDLGGAPHRRARPGCRHGRAARAPALSAATYRVVEPGRFREWQLRPGETLSLRAGDRLVLDAGARLRFEAGKRIPGAPASGVAWADPPERGGLASVLEALGTLVTLVGGALALVGSRPTLGARAVYAGSGLLLVLVLSALCLGVFGAYAAPGLSIGVPALAATFDLPAAIVPGPMGRALGALGA